MALKGSALLAHHNSAIQGRFQVSAEKVIAAGYLRSDGVKASYTNYYTELCRARVQNNARNSYGRKIDMETANALEKGIPFKSRNTLIQREDRLNIVYLHNNPIAKITTNKVYIYSCGYKTKSTKARLNRILMHLCGVQLFQKNSEWFIRDVGEDIPFVEGMAINRI